MKKAIMIVALLMGFFLKSSAQNNDFIKLGQQAPNLAFPNPNGEILKLSELNKGRFILLDFWASWCGPCRMSNPGLVKMYNEFSKMNFKGAKNGFTVVSVSLDGDANQWKAAIEKDGLIWPNHMSDLKKWQSQASTLYGLGFIPQAFLIDPSGKIIGKYMRAEEAKEDIKQYVQ
jgi:thiol-disulfide isomerase/thioredoxin